MRIVNLTPHPVTLVTPEGHQVTVPPSGHVVRAREERETVATVSLEVDGQVVTLPVYRVTYGPPEGLPSDRPEAGTIYIVSALTAQSLRAHRPDWAAVSFLVADPVRDEEGRIIGARALAQV